MNYLYEPSKICLTYGSIISFMFDKSDKPDTPLINEVSRRINPFVKNQENSINLRKEDFSDILTSKDFLFSQGVFNDFCFFHNFRDKTELKYNYYNSLFLVLPRGEFDSLAKFKAFKNRLKKEILMEDDLDIDKQQIIHYYRKFKEEIYTNLEYSIKILNSKDKYVNFNDCVQFMHIKSGKFLEFKKNNESLKIYIQLTDTLSENTIFRFIPAFNYQGENSTKVMINLIIKIACGERQISTDNEKFLSRKEILNKTLKKTLNSRSQAKALAPKAKALNIGKDLLFKAIKKVDEVKYKTFIKIKNDRHSLRKVVNDEKAHQNIKNNFKVYINTSDISYRGFGKKILPNEDETIIAGNRSFNYWRILNFSTNFLEDNKYINSLDYFCIQNDEKNLFIQSINCRNDIGRRKINKYKSNSQEKNKKSNSKNYEQDSFEKYVNEHLKNNDDTNLNSDNQKNYLEETKKTYGNTIKLNYYYEQEFNIESNYELIVNNFEENDYLEPLSLFKFEVVYNTGEYGIYEFNTKYTIDKLKDNSYVRLINVFTNKILKFSFISN